MIDFSALRDRLSSTEAPNEAPLPDQPDRAPDEGLPFAGYDRLGEKRLISSLSDHSQVELEAAETYERSHEGRPSVLDKLRYMRGREPLPRYDALEVEEIVAALGQADWATIKKVRAYERKFANRPLVLDEVVRVHDRQKADSPGPRRRAT
jgi:hypothetical protein